MAKAIDITGKRFGRLVAIEPTDKRSSNRVIWKCKCDCGNICYITSTNLLSGNTKSCKCIQREIFSKPKKKSWRENMQKGRGLHDGTADCLLNTKPNKNNMVGVRGVFVENGKFRAQITYKGKRHQLGCFDTLEQAKEARKIAEKEIWGKDLE